MDITAFDWGVEYRRGKSKVNLMKTIIPRNAPIPYKKTHTFYTKTANQEEMRVKVLQGESRYASRCHTVDQFNLKGLPKGRAYNVCVDETFEIDANGILKVTATSIDDHKNEKTLIINRDKRINLTDEEI